MAYSVTVSECCEADVREVEVVKKFLWFTTSYKVINECLGCGKPCTTKEVCEFCRGTGKIEGTDSDGFPSGHFRKCQECADDYDPDATN